MKQLKTLEQEEANSPRRRRRKEIIKLRAEINQVETKRTIQRINKTRSWFFEKINKIDKPLTRLTKGHRESIQINKIRNENEISQQKPRKFKKSSDPTTKTCTQHNWRIWNKKKLIYPGGREDRKSSNSELKSIKWKPREPYKESTKLKAGSLKKNQQDR